MNFKGNSALNRAKLIRRNALRRLLASRYSWETGYTSYEQIRHALAELGHDVSTITVRNDMDDLKAVKIKIEGETRSFWFIPPWNPELAHLAEVTDQDTIEQEVSSRIAAYVSDGFTWQTEVVLLAEQNCGRMLADWIAMLQWPGMIHVREHAHSVSILCETGEVAEYVLHRLIGVEA